MTQKNAVPAKGLRKKVIDFGKQVQKAGKQTKQRATHQYQRGKLKVQEAEAKAQTRIREKPITSVLLAAGTGLILGSLAAIGGRLLGKPKTKKS